MNRKYTMDVATVRERVDRIKAIQNDVYCPDDYLTLKAGVMYADVLQAIANDTCADPQACAKAALEWRS